MKHYSVRNRLRLKPKREIDVKNLKEEDFKGLILDHYSFLKKTSI